MPIENKYAKMATNFLLIRRIVALAQNVSWTETGRKIMFN
jgi:hypothetical protein